MYEHVAVEHLQYSEHITDSMAQSALRKAVKQVRADQERDYARNQTDLARASMSSRIYTTRCVVKCLVRSNTSKSARQKITITKQLKLVRRAKASPLFPVCDGL